MVGACQEYSFSFLPVVSHYTNLHEISHALIIVLTGMGSKFKRMQLFTCRFKCFCLFVFLFVSNCDMNQKSRNC